MQFTKMQGIGNDFVVIQAPFLQPQPDGSLSYAPDAGPRLAELARRVCSRRTSVGSDGLLAVGPGRRMRMFNPDGTEDTCGNGLRCVGLWLYNRDLLSTEEAQEGFIIDTKDGPRGLRLIASDTERRSGTLCVDMGRPQFAPPDIPFCDANQNRIIDHPLTIADRTFMITCVNTGSTHTVIFGDAPDEGQFQRYSPLIENHPLFPERTSVLWVTPQERDRFSLRIWERGVGETFGCGTGACAVGVAARVCGFSPGEGPVGVVSKGGTLTIDWSGEGADIWMTGPAQSVFEGEIAIADK